MNQRKKKQAGLAKVRQRLADPKPLSDVDRKQIADFLSTVEADIETVSVFIEPTSAWKVNLAEYFLKGLAAGAGLVIAPAAMLICFAVLEMILSVSVSN